jgi:hypothetical protein
MLRRETPRDYCEGREKYGNTLRAYNSEFSVNTKVKAVFQKIAIKAHTKLSIFLCSCHHENADKITT